MKEEWKPMSWCPGSFVSNLGRIKGPTGKLRTIYRYKSGYAFVNLYQREIHKNTSYRVHHVVAHEFIGARPVGHVINHKNFRRSDNKDSNLEYVTPKSNSLYTVLNRRHSFGEKRWSAKLSTKEVKQAIRFLKNGCSVSCIAYRFRVSRRAMYNIVYGRNWKHVTDD